MNVSMKSRGGIILGKLLVWPGQSTAQGPARYFSPPFVSGRAVDASCKYCCDYCDCCGSCARLWFEGGDTFRATEPDAEARL